MTDDPETPDAFPPDFAALVRQAAEDDRRDAALLTENKTILLDHLATTPIAKVHVEFDGEGDSGQIEYTQAWTADGTVAALPPDLVSLRLRDGLDGQKRTQEQTLEQAIETLVYDALAQTHGGWENNEGGFGAFVFDVGARTLRLTMNARVTETLVSRHGF